VAQVFPLTAQVIYETLVADATFMGLLGSYDFTAALTEQPAISIVSAGEDLPALRKVSGVECVIQDAGETRRIEYLTDSPDFSVTWSVFLIAWEPAKGADLQTATERALQRFLGASAVQVVGYRLTGREGPRYLHAGLARFLYGKLLCGLRVRFLHRPANFG